MINHARRKPNYPSALSKKKLQNHYGESIKGYAAKKVAKNINGCVRQLMYKNDYVFFWTVMILICQLFKSCNVMNPLFIFKTNVHFLPTFAFIILYSFPLLMKPPPQKKNRAKQQQPPDPIK